MCGVRGSAVPSGMADARTPLSFWPVLCTVGILSASNILANRVLPAGAYVPWNAAVALLLVICARRLDDLGWVDLAMAQARRGFAVGLSLMATVLGVYLVAWVLPWSRGLFRDRRVGQRSVWSMLGEVFVRIPFGTVLLEEVAFRGVLLGQLARRWGVRVGLAGSSVLFGLWHVLPAWGIGLVNPVVRSAGVGRGAAVVGAVVATTIAGFFMSWLRLRVRSLLAPVMLHVATNSFGFVVAWLTLHGS